MKDTMINAHQTCGAFESASQLFPLRASNKATAARTNLFLLSRSGLKKRTCVRMMTGKTEGIVWCRTSEVKITFALRQHKKETNVLPEIIILYMLQHGNIQESSSDQNDSFAPPPPFKQFTTSKTKKN